MSHRITSLALTFGAVAAVAVPAGASAADRPSGNRACRAATVDCAQVVSETLPVTGSWTRHTLTCPVDQPNAVATRHAAPGTGWDYVASGAWAPDPDVDIVDVVPAADGRGGRVTLSIDSGYPNWSLAIANTTQRFRWAIGCTA